MQHTKDALVELVDYETLSKVMSPFYDVKTLQYSVIKVTEVYINLDEPAYRGEIVFDAKSDKDGAHRPYFSDYKTEEGVWFTESDNHQAIKLISLNQLFIFMSDKMKIEESSNHLLNNFMNILGFVTCYREFVTAKTEEKDGA